MTDATTTSAATRCPNCGEQIRFEGEHWEQGGYFCRTIPNHAAIDAAYHRGYADAERRARMLLMMAVEAVGGEIIISRKETKGDGSLECYVDPASDRIRLRVVTDA